jgi:molybdopterin converting factor small subunit
LLISYSYFGVPVPPLTHEKQEILMPLGSTINELMETICEGIEESSNELLKKATFLVNKTGAQRNFVLNDGDEVIIMHPIGGG